jgi:hypothetical protein
MKQHPIYYKKIPCQFAFLLTEDETVKLQISQLTPAIKEKEFKTLKEAKSFIREFKEIL